MAGVERLVSSVLGEVRRVMEKHKEHERKLCSSLRFLKDDMEMVHTMLKESDVGFHGTLQETRILQLQELAYDVEDFIEGLWEPGSYGYLLVAIGIDRRPQLLESIAGFRDRIASLQKEWKPSGDGDRSGNLDEDAAGSSESSRSMDPEVIDAPKVKLLELLSPSPAELRVISIVGCRGVGKTALARAVYEDPHVRTGFGCVAWFEASGCKNEHDLLTRAPEDRMTTQAKPPAALPLPASQVFVTFLQSADMRIIWKQWWQHQLKMDNLQSLTHKLFPTPYQRLK